jgi:hypothetical protein
MSAPVVNFLDSMYCNQGETLDKFGHDSTGIVQYQFNQQGFRSAYDYDFVPKQALFGASLVFGIGVVSSKIFSSYFPQSHNYGLAGSYTDKDIFQTAVNFVNSDLYTPQVNLVVVWRNHKTDNLLSYYQELQKYNFKQFFCYDNLNLSNCYRVPKQVDEDVSKTHMGPKSHYVFYRILCSLLNR